MRRLSIALLIVVVLGLVAAYAVTRPAALKQDVLVPRTPDLANGETMFHIGGCASCHATVNGGDRLKLGGGLSLRTAFGTFKVPNISTDTKAGIGAWSELSFINAMLKGVGPNGQHLFPSFPYTSYQRMKIEDVRDLFAYLKTLEPDARSSEPHQLQFPFNIRRLVGFWKFLYFDGRPSTPDPVRDAAYNRGAYLVEGPGHCAECHSSRNIFGAIRTDQRFAGGPGPTGEGWAPNLTPHQDGLADWSVAELEYFLASGLTPQGFSVEGDMMQVIANTAKLAASDRLAMAVYLKSLPARPGKAPAKKQ